MGAMAASSVMRAPDMPTMGIPGTNMIMTTDRAAKTAVRAMSRVERTPPLIFHLSKAFSKSTIHYLRLILPGGDH